VAVGALLGWGWHSARGCKDEILLEFFPGNKHERTVAVVGAVAKARTVKPTHGFALGNVAEVKDACASFGLKIRVIHEPNKNNPNPAYAAIRNYRSDEIQLLQLLASEVWSEVIEARNYLAPEQAP